MVFFYTIKLNVIKGLKHQRIKGLKGLVISLRGESLFFFKSLILQSYPHTFFNFFQGSIAKSNDFM